MSKIEEAKAILKALGLPPAQQNEIAAFTLLALCNIRKDDTWKNAVRRSLGVSKGIMAFIELEYNRAYKPNTRESVRKNVLHYLEQARVVDYNPDDPTLPTNSSKAHYAITDEALNVVREYGTDSWGKAVSDFKEQVGHLAERYAKNRASKQVVVRMPDGSDEQLSPGEHNVIQAAVIEQFLPNFAEGARIVYFGDTAKKQVKLDKELLAELKIPIDEHSKLPDVVLYHPEKNWLFLIEAVASVNPVSPKRQIEMEEFLKDCPAGRVYVSAFLTFKDFIGHSRNIAWETEVWIVEAPTHMIHFNGDRFIGPRSPNKACD